MALFINTATIRAPRERVFDFLAGHDNELAWNMQHTPVDFEVTESDRPNHLTEHVGGNLEMTQTVTCLDSNDGMGTRLDIATYARPHGAMAVMFPLMERRFRRMLEANIERIKHELEAA